MCNIFHQNPVITFDFSGIEKKNQVLKQVLLPSRFLTGLTSCAIVFSPSTIGSAVESGTIGRPSIW